MRALMERWRDLYGTEPPPHNKKFLISRLAYRIQELAYGGVSEDTMQRLDEQLKDAKFTALGMRRAGTAPQQQMLYKQYAVGTIFCQEWKGQVYKVMVVRDGFEYEGKVYKYLSPIAQRITGSHRSGNAFFGFTDRKKRKGK